MASLCKRLFFQCIVSSLLIIALLQGCGTAPLRNPVPENRLDVARLPGMPGIRAWGDEFSPVFHKGLIDSVAQEKESGLFHASDTVNILALSGGGADGAYGAGLLCGWTEAGDRPVFKLVTGVSTGALAAPYAFLGSDYDSQLRDSYLNVTSKNIFTKKWWAWAIRSDSMALSKPLSEMIAEQYDDRILQQIAVEHKKGRRLYIGTTNLDAQRPVVWDMGAIASSGHPDALKLFRKVLIASASIPVALPPVYIQVEADGEKRGEMHVDGGVTTQVFLYGPMMRPLAALKEFGLETYQRRPRVFVIRNTQIDPKWQAVKPRIIPIGLRTIGTLLKYHGLGDLYRIYAETMRDKIEYNLAFIPSEIDLERKEEFDPAAMKKMFDLGYSMAKEGYPWLNHPPTFQTAEEQMQ